MYVANFTDENLDWMHEGISGTVKPGEVVDLPESRARFILNKLGRRGLVQMEYSEDPKYKPRKMQESKDLNDKFWQYQVENHNRHNETLKAANKSYVRPTEQVFKAAQKFGLELLGPWKIKQPDVKTLADTSNNAELGEVRSQVDRLTSLVAQLLQVQAGTALPTQPILTDPHPEDAEPEPNNINGGVKVPPDISTATEPAYKSLPRKQLEPWIKAHIKDILDWSADDLAALDERYKKLCGKPLNLKDYEK